MAYLNILKSKVKDIKSEKAKLLNDTDIGTVINDQKIRIEICRECEFYFKPTAQCKKCGCFLHAKTRIAASRCPLKKW